MNTGIVEEPEKLPALAVYKQGLRANSWPKPREADLRSFYGRHDFDEAGEPTDRWFDRYMKELSLPYPMRLSWEPARTIWKCFAHEQVHGSLRRVLLAILAYYGSTEKVRAARMDLFGGVYNFRRARGLHVLSMHAYGAAIDLDPEKNPMGQVWKPNKGMMPEVVVDIFEAEGWKWGGHWKSRPDCMHFEATS